jgi:hypothetical protein
VEPDALPAWAKEHAGSFLADLVPRWQHVCGVARQAQRISEALDEVDRPYLVAAAWLQDIGYAPKLAATAFHPLDGACHLRSLGQERLARLVAYHSSGRWEAEALGLRDDLAAFPREDSFTADALTYCDMTSSPTGQPTTLANRLTEIAERYGAEHLVVRCLQLAQPDLTATIQRAEARLAAL